MLDQLYLQNQVAQRRQIGRGGGLRAEEAGLDLLHLDDLLVLTLHLVDVLRDVHHAVERRLHGVVTFVRTLVVVQDVL